MKILDGFKNVITGIGTLLKDKTMQNIPVGIQYLSDRELEALYVGDGIGKRIISAVVDDALKKWIRIEEDVDGKLDDYCKKLKLKRTINKAYKLARAFGGALVVIGANDRLELDMPIGKKPKTIEWLRVYDRRFIRIHSSDYDTDPNSKRFGEIEYFNVEPVNGKPFRVHYTRAVQILGDDIVEGAYNPYIGWGIPVMQSVWKALGSTSMAFNIVEILMQEWVQSVISIKGLKEMMAAGEEQKIKNRVDVMMYSKSMINAIILDADSEQYDRQALGGTGLPEIMDRMMMYISAVTGYPVTKIWGRSAAGLNSTGDGDLNNYYDWIKSEQEDKLHDPILYILRVINSSADSPKIKDVTFEFVSLYQQTDNEILEMRKKQAEIDRTYWDMDVLTTDEIRQSRFGDKWTMETEISESESEGKQNELDEYKKLLESAIADKNRDREKAETEKNEADEAAGNGNEAVSELSEEDDEGSSENGT